MFDDILYKKKRDEEFEWLQNENNKHLENDESYGLAMHRKINQDIYHRRYP